MNLRPANQRIEISGEDAVRIFRVIELTLTSLHKIGSFYDVAKKDEKGGYERETARFIDEWKITHRLAKARALLSECFDLTLGEDDVDDLEREAESIDYWSGPGSLPSDIG